MTDPALLREAFDLLADIEDPSGPAASIHQPRRTLRHSCRLEMSLTTGTEKVWGLTRDMSAGGLSCVLRMALPIKAPVRVRLPLRLGGHQEMEAQVAHCTPLINGWYLLGVMFLEMVNTRQYVKGIASG